MMEKFKSCLIREKDIKVETDRYYEDDIRHEVVKITHIPTGLVSTTSSQISQVNAYNISLRKLEEKLKENDR